MNFRNTKSSTQKTKNLTFNQITYTLVRSDVFYYIKFINYDKELFNSNSNLTSKPNIIFYTENSENKIILDYSLANETDKKYLTSFFTNINKNDDFNLNNASYLDKSELEANLGCTLSFREFKENKIFAKINTIINKNNSIDLYDGNFFISTPQLFKSGNLGINVTTNNYALVFVNPNTKKPLSSLGYIPGDIIEVINPNSLNNGTKFQITNTTTTNGQEIINLKPILDYKLPESESLIGLPCIVNLYVETKGKTTLEPQLSGTLGCCFDTTNGIDKVVAVKNNTKYQCNIRFFANNFTTFGCEKGLELIQSNSLGNPLIPNQIVVVNNGFDMNGEWPSIPYTFNSKITKLDYTDNVIFELIPETTLSSELLVNFQIKTNGKKIGFFQADQSNIGYIIRFSSDPEYYTPYTTGVYGGIRYSGYLSKIMFHQPGIKHPPLWLFLEKTGGLSYGSESIIIKTNYSIVF